MLQKGFTLLRICLLWATTLRHGVIGSTFRRRALPTSSGFSKFLEDWRIKDESCRFVRNVAVRLLHQAASFHYVTLVLLPSNENSLGHSVRSVQPPFQGVSGVKRPEIEADHSPLHLAPRLRMSGVIPTLHLVSMACTVTLLLTNLIRFIASLMLAREGHGRGVVLNDSGNYSTSCVNVQVLCILPLE